MDDAAALPRRRWPIAIGIAALAAMCLFTLLGFAWLVLGIIRMYGPHESHLYDISSGACRVDPASGDALVQLSMMRSYGDGWFSVKPPASRDITVEGVAVFGADQSIADMQDDGLTEIAYRTYLAGRQVEIDPGGSTVVLRLARHSDASQVTLNELVLSGGWELPKVQHVPLGLVWSGSSCSVDL